MPVSVCPCVGVPRRRCLDGSSRQNSCSRGYDMTFDLPSLGWDDSFAAAYRADAGPDDQPGRVTRVDRGVCTVLTAAGLGARQPGRRRAARRPPTIRTACPAPATGSSCAAGRTTGSPSRRCCPAAPAVVRRTADKDVHRPGAGRQHGHGRRGRADGPRARPRPDRAAAGAGAGSPAREPMVRADQGRPRRRPGGGARRTWPPSRPGVAVLAVSARARRRPRPRCARWWRRVARSACSARPARASRRWSTRWPGRR